MTLKEKKREQIIEKASALFAKRDFHAVQMDEIADAASVSKGTLYNHFESKDDLYASIVRTRLERLNELLASAFESGEDPWRNLRDFILHYEGFMRKHPHFFQILCKCQALFANGSDANLRLIRTQPRKTLEQILQAGIRSGVFRNIDPKQTADLILGMIEARVHSMLETGNKKSALDGIFDLLQQGLNNQTRKEPA